jgi:hypothetical protein
MKNNHVLVDYENIQPELSSALEGAIFKVWIFVGAQQNKVKFDLVDLIQRKGPDAKVIKMTSSGPNALDFHMSFYLGELATREPDSYFHVITADGGMDPLLDHLKSRGIKANRYRTATDMSFIRPSRDVSLEEKLSRAIEYLVSRGSQRPASVKTLSGSLSALFRPRLEDAEVTTIIDVLVEQGVVALNGNAVIYGLPDEP